jgi:mevalonate kinase
MALPQKYYSHGKLLITGEYAVLDGAIALAIPTKLGQWLEVTLQTETDNITWESMDIEGDCWFTATFSSSLEILKTSEIGIAETLQKILKSTVELNPSFKKNIIGANVNTTLEFDRNWGLGSSSTLIHLIAQWAKVDAFILLNNSFGGSGYDIACANATGPILFQKTTPPRVTPVHFKPEWTDKMYFVYLGEKQISSSEITKYSTLEFDRNSFSNKISELTNQLVQANVLTHFTHILDQHEALLSSTLGYPTIKSQRFNQIHGTFKSLGAWGGDFVLFIGEVSELRKIKELGYPTIISWKEMLISTAY